MKRTVLDGKQWILKILLSKEIDKIITGKIYKDRRPVNSIQEDIVINSLTMTNDYLQNGVFNVNCHIPMKIINVGGITQCVQDEARMKTISTALYEALNEVWQDNFNLYVVNHQVIEDGGDMYYNFRVSINAYPI